MARAGVGAETGSISADKLEPFVLDAVLRLLTSAAGRLPHQIGDSATGFDSALDPSNSSSAAPIAAARSGAASGVGAE